MFGTNQVRGAETSDGTILQIAEIFYTIQGEGPFIGRPAVFVRLTGCHLRCWFCDTKWDDEHDPQMHVSEIMHRINQLSKDTKLTKLVVLTGGEPMRQQLLPLIDCLVASGGYRVQIETAGTYWQPELEPFTRHGDVVLVCSPKTKHVHPGIKTNCYHWKYIISAHDINKDDGLPDSFTQVSNPKELVTQTTAFPVYTDLVRKFGAPARPPMRDDITVWLSPCDEYDADKNARNKALVASLAMQYGYRAQIQLHKELGLP